MRNANIIRRYTYKSKSNKYLDQVFGSSNKSKPSFVTSNKR